MIENDPDKENLTVTVIMPIQRQYAYTLRRTRLKTPLTREMYRTHLHKLASLGCSFKQNEFEEPSGLHMHGVVLIPDGFNFKRLRYRGWHFLLVEIYDYQGWIKYIEKDKVTQTDRDKFNEYINSLKTEPANCDSGQ